MGRPRSSGNYEPGPEKAYLTAFIALPSRAIIGSNSSSQSVDVERYWTAPHSQVIVPVIPSVCRLP